MRNWRSDVGVKVWFAMWFVVKREIEGEWSLAAEVETTSAERAIANVASEQGRYRVRRRDGAAFQYFRGERGGGPRRGKRQGHEPLLSSRALP